MATKRGREVTEEVTEEVAKKAKKDAGPLADVIKMLKEGIVSETIPCRVEQYQRDLAKVQKIARNPEKMIVDCLVKYLSGQQASHFMLMARDAAATALCDVTLAGLSFPFIIRYRVKNDSDARAVAEELWKTRTLWGKYSVHYPSWVLEVFVDPKYISEDVVYKVVRHFIEIGSED